jgi:hypothetical protein
MRGRLRGSKPDRSLWSILRISRIPAAKIGVGLISEMLDESRSLNYEML